MSNIVALALDKRVQTLCIEREFNPNTSRHIVTLPSNFFVQRIREREQGIVHPPPEHICLQMSFSENSKDLYEQIMDACNQIGDPSVNVIVQPPVAKHRKILRPECAEKDMTLRAKHAQIEEIQREVMREFGIGLGLGLGEYKTPNEWLMNGDEYMDYDRCSIQIFCSKGSDLYKAIVESELTIY